MVSFPITQLSSVLHLPGFLIPPYPIVQLFSEVVSDQLSAAEIILNVIL